MKNSKASKYVVNIFFGGIQNDLDPEFLDSKNGSVLEAHALQLSNIARSKMQLIRGDKWFASYNNGVIPTDEIVFIGGLWVKGYVVCFYRDETANLTYVYANKLLIGQSADYPATYFDCDSNDEIPEIFITDNVTAPLVLNLQDMLDHIADQKYFTDYDKTLYEVNKPIQLNQPVFVQLEDLGPGGGLRVGSYSYAMCYASLNGDNTPWSQVTPYIPVPESAVSLNATADNYAAGIKTWGGVPSLFPSRYGIRLKIRVANIAGFDYIKLKRYSNNTGQPISYIPSAEYIILSTEASGGTVDIKSDPYSVIEFVDSFSKVWAILDDSITQAYSTIKKARTVRYVDRRIVYGGIEYESKLVPNIDKSDMFLTEGVTDRIAFPIVKLLGTEGFANIGNQVYYKSHRLGERYGYAIKLYDSQGNTLFSVPIKHGTESKNDFTNYKFPERRERIPVAIKRVDTISLTGTAGTATVLCNGVSKLISFDRYLDTTATNFWNANKADYLTSGVVLTRYQSKLIFTAVDAGTDFTGATSITTTSDVSNNLNGTVDPTQVNVNWVPQTDYVVLSGWGGDFELTVNGVMRVVEFAGDYGTPLSETAIMFCDLYAWYYAQVGINIDYLTDNNGPGGAVRYIIRVYGADANTFTTNVANSHVLNGTVTTEEMPTAGVAQIDTVTITGSGGNALITCNGIQRIFSYVTSPTLTASAFVIAWNEAALLDPITYYGISCTSSGPDVIFTAITAGVPFNSATTIVNRVNSLGGTVSYTVANGLAGGEIAFSPAALEDSTIESWDADTVGYVYDPVKAKRSQRDSVASIPGNNITSDQGKDYLPVTPTGRGGLANNNKYAGLSNMEIMTEVEGVDNRVGQYGRYISTIGLRFGGIDTSKLPSNVRSFSVVRTPAAGRVVCQGIAMYALTEQGSGATNPSLVKALDKVWFYSPELDAILGDKSIIYEDIKNNPQNYQMQLVAPCGFISDFYSSYAAGNSSQDLVSLPFSGAGANAKTIFPPDAGESIGRADYISFGQWRWPGLQGSGIDATLTFDIDSAVDRDTKVRVPYLELSLGSNLYYTTNVKKEACTTDASKKFHEPWYIVNIIQNSKAVPVNNVNSYNDIGHVIHLESIIGLSNGSATQTFPLVEERQVDVLGDGTATAATYRYIWVDGDPWLCSNMVNLATYLADLESNGSFTPSGGLECFGVYTVLQYADKNGTIIFDKVLPSSGDAVVPETGAKISIKYNSNSPIEVFLGDTIIGDSTFLAVDGAPDQQFAMNAPMPQYAFTFSAEYYQAINSSSVDKSTAHTVKYVRQWLISFTCESTINLPFLYKNFFPNRVHAMRPVTYTEKTTDQTIDAYLTSLKIFPEYNDDFPDEYLNWKYGGFSTPALANYDYEKLLPVKSFTEPVSGANEILIMKKRLHFSTQSSPGYPSNKVFVPSNIYDLKNDRASQISILYDVYSERGSNLYVVTDRGSGMLLIDKNMISTAEGGALTVQANDSSFIKGEVWLSNALGCPAEFWRGKSEGDIKLPNNVVAPILVFPTYNDIVMLSNNNFIQILDNNRQAILTELEKIDLSAPFTTKLYSVIDEGENKLWMNIGDYTFGFNFDQNNWDCHVYQLGYEKSFNVKYLTTTPVTNDRNVLAHAVNSATLWGLTMSHKLPARVSSIATKPYVIFSTTPAIGDSVEFVDMFISCAYKPYSVQFSITRAFTDSSTVLAAKITSYNDGWHYIHGLPRTGAGKVLIGRTLFVKVTFSDYIYLQDIKLCKIGYKDLVEG